MADVSLTFRGQDVGAVQTTQSVEDALEALAQQALATSAVIRQALDGVNGDPAQREIEKVNDELRETQEEARETTTALALLAGAGGLAGLVISAQLVQSAFNDIRWPAIWAAIGPGIALVGDLAAELFAVGAALAPLAGAFAAMPAVIFAFADAMLVLKLGFQGVGEAMKAAAEGDAKKFEEALQGLTPAAQEFAYTFRDDVNPQLEALKALAQENIFQGINDGLAAATTDANWAALRSLVDGMSQTWANFFRLLGEELSDPQWAADLRILGDQSATFMGHLLDALLLLLPAFRDLAVAAGPFLEDLGELAVRLAEWTSEAVAGARESGALADQFDRVKETAGLVWDILYPLVQVLYDVGQAAAPLGREILADLGDSLQRIANFTGSAGGSNALADYFRAARPVILEINGLIGDLIEGLGRLAINPQFQAMLENLISRLRTEVLPIFLEVAEATAIAFGPALVDAIVEVLRLFGALAGSNGPLVELVEMIGAIAGFLADMLEKHPALQELVITLGGILTWAKLMSATGITTFITTLISSLILMTTASEGATVSALGLNAALRANPVGLVVTAIQALVAVLIIAYTQSDDFRRIVDETWRVIQIAVIWFADFAQTVWDLIEPFRYAIPVFGQIFFLFENFPEIINTTVAAFNFLVSAANSVANAGQRIWEFIEPFRYLIPIVGPAIALFENFPAVINAAVAAFNALTNIVNTVRTAFQGVVGFIENFRTNFLNVATRAGEAILNGIVNGLTGIVSEVERFLNRVRDEIVERVSIFTTQARRLGTAIFNGIVNAITGLVTRVRTVIGNVLSTVSGFAARFLTAGRSIGTALFNGIRNALTSLATIVSGLIRGAINAALRVVNIGIGRINSALEFSISIPFAPDIDFDPRDIPTIPYLASGGIVTGPTLAMIGDNPSGREAVIPLERAGEMGFGGSLTINVGGSVIQERDLGRTVRDAVVKAQRRDSGFLTHSPAAVPR